MLTASNAADTRQSLDVFKGRISCALTRPEPRFQRFLTAKGFGRGCYDTEWMKRVAKILLPLSIIAVQK
jgi:hypothetical protein